MKSTTPRKSFFLLARREGETCQSMPFQPKLFLHAACFIFLSEMNWLYLVIGVAVCSAIALVINFLYNSNDATQSPSTSAHVAGMKIKAFHSLWFSLFAGIFIYPVKSCGRIELNEAKIVTTGFEFDRHWMLIDHKGFFRFDAFFHCCFSLSGRFQSQREFPKLTLVRPVLNLNSSSPSLTLSAPGMKDFVLSIASSFSESLEIPSELRGKESDEEGAKLRKVTVWDSNAVAVDEVELLFLSSLPRRIWHDLFLLSLVTSSFPSHFVRVMPLPNGSPNISPLPHLRNPRLPSPPLPPPFLRKPFRSVSDSWEMWERDRHRVIFMFREKEIELGLQMDFLF